MSDKVESKNGKEEEKQMITCGKCGTEYEIDESTDLNLCPNCEQSVAKTVEDDLEDES